MASLKSIKDKLPAIAEERLESGRSAYDIVVMISLINRDIHQRALELAAVGLGVPPVPYCLYLTGSHGRLENLLTPDQDHGMIIADSEQNYQYDQYFIDLGVRLSDYLAQIGYVYLRGNIAHRQLSRIPMGQQTIAGFDPHLTHPIVTPGVRNRRISEPVGVPCAIIVKVPAIGQSVAIRIIRRGGIQYDLRSLMSRIRATGVRYRCVIQFNVNGMWP